MTGQMPEYSSAGATDISFSDEGNTISVRNRFNYSYEVLFAGKDILSAGNPTLHDAIAGRKCLVVMGEKVNAIYGKRVEDYFRRWFDRGTFSMAALPVSEHTKNIETVMKICAEGKRFGLDRRSLFVAIGGGVLMDAVGLASSIYMRKLDYVRVPTTLVGQVDAGIGLKTGVNFEDGKNFIGSFHPPTAVLNDFRFLRTLSAEEIRNGLAEIAKMAIVADAGLFSMLENNSTGIVHWYTSGENETLTREINIRAAGRMLEQLQLNPYENSLERIVDFGHTFSPFIEMHTGHRIRHGRAVALDMAISAEISCILGRADTTFRNRILSMLSAFGFSLHDDEAFDAELMWQSLDPIILRRGGKLNLVVPTAGGRGEFLRDKMELEKAVLEQALANLNGYRPGDLLE